MARNHGLTISVSERGIYIGFTASDGSETQIDALDIIEGSSALTNKPLVRWYRERIQEARPSELSDQARAALEAIIDQIEAFSDTELEEALQAGSNLPPLRSTDPEPKLSEWLERAEQQVAEARYVLMTGEAFAAFLGKIRTACLSEGRYHRGHRIVS